MLSMDVYVYKFGYLYVCISRRKLKQNGILADISVSGCGFFLGGEMGNYWLD